MSTMYASFLSASEAERAVGALIDHGARPEEISLIANETHSAGAQQFAQTRVAHEERAGKEGLSTTTAGDAVLGAAKGTFAGLGVGIAAALVSLLVPGVGLVVGGGALATAIGAAAATAGAGAVAGGVAGYLEDQGVGQEMATRYSNTFTQGGVILAIAVPTGSLDAVEVEQYLAKYGASDIATYNTPIMAMERNVQREPMVVQTNPNVDPVAIVPPAVVPVTPVVPVAPVPVVDTLTGDVLTTATGPVAQPGITAPPVAVSPLTGEVAPATPVASAAFPTIRATRVDPVTGQMVEGVMIDPATGLEKTVFVSNGVTVDASGQPIPVVTPTTRVVDSGRGELL